MRKLETKSFSLEVDVKSALPIYEQIKSAVKISIFAGNLKPGDQLVSIRELSTRHHINPITIMKAYNQLEIEGFLSSRRGSGYYVKDNPEELSHGKLEVLRQEVADFMKKIAALGFTSGDLLEEIERHTKENHDD